MNVDVAEYDVLLERRDADSFAGNVVTYAPSNNPNQGDGTTTGGTTPASLTSERASGPFTYDYDLAMLSDRASNDGGVEIPPSADIAGKVWKDTDYDGFIDEDEEIFANKTVILKRWTYDVATGQWSLADTISTQTDADGNYRFSTMPIATRVNSDSPVWSLNGYTIEINGVEEDVDATGMGGRPLTLWQQAPDPDDPTQTEDLNSKAARPASIDPSVYRELYTDGNYPVTFNVAANSGAPVFQNRIVLTQRAGENTATLPEYLVGGFDLTAPQGQEHMNAGFGQFRTSVLRGVVWNDSDYNGVRDVHIDRLDGSLPLVPATPAARAVDTEAGLPGLEVRLVRYCYKDGQWVSDGNFATSYLADADPAAGLYAKAGDTASVYVKTDAEGVYEFTDLPSFVPKGRGADKDEFYLASYRVEVVRDATTGQYVVTRFHTAAATTRTDSDMTTDIDHAEGNYQVREIYDVVDAAGTVTSQRGDGRIMLSTPATATRNSQYAVRYEGLIYDLFDSFEAQRGGDAGFKMPATMVVSGTAWVDANADGVWDDEEGGLPNVAVQLRRYWYDVDRDQWRFDRTFGTDGVAETTSNAEGYWEFTRLPATGVLLPGDGIPADEGSRGVVYGYRANVVGFPDGYYPSDLNVVDDPEHDSDLDDGTTRLIPDEGHHGLIVLTSPAEDDEDDATIIAWTGASSERWSLANTHDSHHNDAGFAPKSAAVIAGKIWDDDDLNGVQDEGEIPIPLGTVYLERTKVPRAQLTVDPAEFDKQGWTITDGAPGSDLRGSDGEPLTAASWKAPTTPTVTPTPGGSTGWSQVASCRVDMEGRYSFGSLAMVDSDGLPWRYRVRYERPEGTFYAPVNLGANDDMDNDWAPDNPDVSIDAGGSPSLDVVVPRVGGTVNAYGQLWKMHQPINWTDREDEDGNPIGASVDFGFTWPPTVTIAGAVWEDEDANGLRAFRIAEDDEGDEVQAGDRVWTEPGIGEVYVELRRYWYMPAQFVGDDPFIIQPKPEAPEKPTVPDAPDAGGEGEGPDAPTDPTDSGEATEPEAVRASVLAAATGERAAVRAADGGYWVYDTNFNATGSYGEVPGRYSDEDGDWAFTGLPTTGEVSVDGVVHRVVFGYRVNVPVLPEGYETTLLNEGDDATVDSDLDEMNTRLIPDAPEGGLIVPSKRSDGTESELSLVQNAPGGTPRSLAVANDCLSNDAGLVPRQSVTISGVAWDDPDKDGIRDEDDEILPNLTVRLERRVVAPAETAARDDFGTYTTDGAPGSDLTAEGEPKERAGRGVVRIPAADNGAWALERPLAGDVAVGGAGDGDGAGGGVDDGTSPGDGSGDGSGGDGGSGDSSGDGSGGDGGSGDGDGTGGDDGSGDGNDADDEPKYHSYGRESSPVVSAGSSWQTVATMRTDGAGAYRFEGNPLVDGNGNAYEYRVVTDRPAEAEFVPSHAGASDNFDSDIDPLEGDDGIGATDALTVVKVRESLVNAYGQTWRASSPQHWTFETERSLDIGWWWESDSWFTKIFYKRLPQTGDTLVLGALLMLALASQALALAMRRRRKKDNERPDAV